MKKILVVDDMVVSLMITENILSTCYEVVCAASGQEAIEVYQREKPDMVLSDFRMPGMTGFELQKKLEEEAGSTIPFMFMTADKDSDTESQGFDNGAMDFIHKPFRPDVLLRRVGNILQTVDQIQGLKRYASIDSLTGLLNKAAAEEELAAICKKNTGALMMIDLDSFKLVNDIYGHSMGDEILMSFADIIRSVMRPKDLVGRMGGDEFIAFCYGLLDEAGIAHKSEYINEKLLLSAKKLMGEDMNIPLGASIGCVFLPTEGTDYEDLFKKADKALYTVKQNGKHGYSIFSSSKETDRQEENIDTGIGSTVQILAERGNPTGAMQVSFEHFRTVFRFLSRTIEFFGKPFSLVSFTIEKKANAEDCDLFMETLRTALRKGDVITEYGAHQFLVLLQGVKDVEETHAVERIKKTWQDSLKGKEINISYEAFTAEPQC